MCHVVFAYSGRLQPAYLSPQVTIVFHLLSAQGSHRVQISIVWRGYGEDRFRTARNDNQGASTWVCLGPFMERRLKPLQASHLWAAGDARAQAIRTTGKILGDCLQNIIEIFGGIRPEGKGQKWVTVRVIVKVGRD